MTQKEISNSIRCYTNTTTRIANAIARDLINIGNATNSVGSDRRAAKRISGIYIQELYDRWEFYCTIDGRECAGVITKTELTTAEPDTLHLSHK